MIDRQNVDSSIGSRRLDADDLFDPPFIPKARSVIGRCIGVEVQLPTAHVGRQARLIRHEEANLADPGQSEFTGSLSVVRIRAG